MSPETLLRQFDVMADSPHGIQKLRELILQLAVRGRLVPQDPRDESAGELLKQVGAAKERLYRKGAIRKLMPTELLSSDAAPYPVPEAWQWVRLSSLGEIVGGGTPRTDAGACWAHEGGIPWISPADLNGAQGKYVRSGRRQLSQYGLERSSAQLLPAGAVLFSSRAPIGYVAIAACPLATNQGFKSCVPYIDGMSDYLYRFLQAVAPEIDRNAPGTTFREVSGKLVGQIAVPLPPIGEQARIAAKTDELMTLCDELEARQRRRAETRVRLNRSMLHHIAAAGDDADLAAQWHRLRDIFGLLYDSPETVTDLRKAVMQLAVHGKLVSQDPKDGPASVLLERIAAEKARLSTEGRIGTSKALPPVGEDEVRNHSIPPTWSWTRLGAIVESMDSGWSPACPDREASSPDEWGVLRTTAVQRLEYRDFEHKALPQHLEPRPACEVHAGDLLITRAGPKNRVGIPCVVLHTRPRLMISDKIIRCHPLDRLFEPMFVAICLNSGVSAEYIEAKKSGMAESQVNISQANLAGTPVPVPPLAEQCRIVAKVSELMAFFDRLEAQLTHAREKSAHLAASVLHHLAAA